MADANDCDDCRLNRHGGIQVVEKPRVINVSPSLLADVAVCGTKAYTRHKLGYTSITDAIKATAGSAFHAAIAEHLRTDRPFSGSYANTMKAFHDVYDAPYERLSAELLEPSLTPKNLERILDRWIAMHPSSLLPWKRVLTVEEAFVSREWVIIEPTSAKEEEETGENLRRTRVQLICRPDLIVEDHDGYIGWVDTKTTGWHIGDAGWQKQLKLSLQVQLYSDAVVQRYGSKARYGGWFNAIELRKLPGEIDAPPKLKKDGTPAKPRTCAEHGVPYAQCGSEHAKAEFIKCLTTPQRVERALVDAQGYAADFVRLMSETDIERVDMRGTAKGECRFCPASDWCLSDRPVDALDGFMKHEPWIVDTGSR
jgi:hypothetical protein